MASDPAAAEAPGLRFAAWLGALGPFETPPRLAIAASGGADSTALALLAAAWAQERGGTALALIVDHGLRAGSDAEAALTRARLAARGIEARILTLRGLGPGPALAARARAARYAALIASCRAERIVHLLLGHHAADQAETRLMRARAASGAAGLAAMAALREIADVRLLRPLLAAEPGALRALLRARGMSWVEDPSNADPARLRARLRAELAAEQGEIGRLAGLSRADGVRRAAAEGAVAAELARRAEISPLGYAVLSPGTVGAAALGALIRVIGGRDHAPAAARIARLAAAPGPATLGGVRLLAAGRLGPGLLLVRETPRPMVAARDGARWDRFVLRMDEPPEGWRIGALGAQAARLRGTGGLPAAVLRTLPALYDGARLMAVPGIGWAEGGASGAAFRFAPPEPACGAPFAGPGEGDA